MVSDAALLHASQHSPKHFLGTAEGTAQDSPIRWFEHGHVWGGNKFELYGCGLCHLSLMEREKVLTYFIY